MPVIHSGDLDHGSCISGITAKRILKHALKDIPQLGNEKSKQEVFRTTENYFKNYLL